jgi:hypothetical protein
MVGPASKRLATAVVKAVDMAHTVHERLDASLEGATLRREHRLLRDLHRHWHDHG